MENTIYGIGHCHIVKSNIRMNLWVNMTIFMTKYCKICDRQLELCQGVEPWNTDHMICPICNGTYNIDELEKCNCKYGHADGKCKWPTLEGRLNQPLTSKKEALLQMYRIGGVTMSEAALRKVEKYLEEDEKLQEVRKKIQAAVDAQPKSVTFEEAKKQVENSKL